MFCYLIMSRLLWPENGVFLVIADERSLLNHTGAIMHNKRPCILKELSSVEALSSGACASGSGDIFPIFWGLYFFVSTPEIHCLIMQTCFPNPLNGCSVGGLFSIIPLYVRNALEGSAIQWWNGEQKEVARGRQWWMGSVWSHWLSVKHTLHLFSCPAALLRSIYGPLHNSVAYWRERRVGHGAGPSW